MKGLTLIVFVILLLAPAAHVHAIPHNYYFSGTTTVFDSGPPEYFPEGWDLLSVGTPFLGTFGFDVSDPPPIPYSSVGSSNIYSQLDLHLSVSFGGMLNFYIDQGFQFTVSPDGISDHELIYFANFKDDQYGEEGGIFRFTGANFTSSLIEDLPTLSDSLFTDMYIGFDFLGDWSPYRCFHIGGRIDSLRPVPEPATGLLISLGLVGITAYKRKFKLSKSKK